MKKIFGIMLFTAMLWLLSCQLFAATITAEDLRGDDNFINKILSLQKEDNTVVDNAIYVATDGSNSNKGTIDSPYETVYYAISKAKAGQTIYVRGGTYNQNIVITKSGTEGNYITIRNYPNEKPVFDHTNYATDGGAIIELSKVNYIHIQGLKLCNKDLKSNSGYGILMRQGNHIIIKDVEISNINVPDPTSSKVGANAIILYGNNASVPISNVLIDNCYVHDCQTGWNEAVTVNGNSEYVNVINSRIENIGNIGLDFAGHFNACKDSSLDQARYCVAVGNVVSKCVSPNATSYGLYNDGGRDNTFDRNVVYECSGGIEIGSEELQANYPVKNVIVRNNLVYKNSCGGIRVGGYEKKKTGYVTETKIYNNTLVDNGEGEGGYNGEFCFVKCNGVDVRNNMVYKSSNKYPLIGGDLPAEYTLNVTFNNNVFYDTNSSDSTYFEYKGSSQEGIDAFNTFVGGTNYSGKPSFNSDYSLANGSYGIDLGDNGVLNDMGSLVDLGNNYRAIGTVDVGAFGYQDGSKPTVTTVSTTTVSTTTTTTEATTETTTYDKADLNKDGNVDKKDCAIMLKLIQGLKTDIVAPDLNKDGKIDLLDALWYLAESSAKVWNYTTGENTDNFYSVKANNYKNATTITYNGLILTKAVKMETGTAISFTAPKDGTLTLVANGGSGKKIKVNNVSYAIVSDGALEVPVKAGTVTVSKDSTGTYLYYMSFK